MLPDELREKLLTIHPRIRERGNKSIYYYYLRGRCCYVLNEIKNTGVQLFIFCDDALARPLKFEYREMESVNWEQILPWLKESLLVRRLNADTAVRINV
ncbi:hypothetical protein [Chitinophaga sp. 22620]|uniref:hypothetical protein n=1 Tax=Chitinophaga sp. 22620 TaxID=3453952 RepID=UPI003F826908